MAEIPVVDFACLNCYGESKEANADEVKKLAKEMNNAFASIGFVYIKNHGIPANEVRSIIKLELYQLRHNIKAKFA